MPLILRSVQSVFMTGESQLYDEPQQNQRSALHKAAWRAHIDVVELLVENGADIEQKDKVQYFPTC